MFEEFRRKKCGIFRRTPCGVKSAFYFSPYFLWSSVATANVQAIILASVPRSICGQTESTLAVREGNEKKFFLFIWWGQTGIYPITVFEPGWKCAKVSQSSEVLPLTSISPRMRTGAEFFSRFQIQQNLSRRLYVFDLFDRLGHQSSPNLFEHGLH